MVQQDNVRFLMTDQRNRIAPASIPEEEEHTTPSGQWGLGTEGSGELGTVCV